MLSPRTSPIEAVFLGLDPALHTSGAAVLVPDYGAMNEPEHAFEGGYVLHEFGKVASQSERERYIETALEMSEELRLPAVVVAETWDGPRDRKIRLPGGEIAYARDPKWTYETILKIGEGWGRWSAEIEAANEFLRENKKPEILLERVLPNDWRDDMFGERRPKDTDALKATARRYFESVFGYAASADISEAGCIALWGARATSVQNLLAAREQPLKRRKRSA